MEEALTLKEFLKSQVVLFFHKEADHTNKEKIFSHLPLIYCLPLLCILHPPLCFYFFKYVHRERPFPLLFPQQPSAAQ